MSNRLEPISVDDDIRFKTHVEVLALFGKNYKAHMTATSRLDDNWLIWFPKFYKNQDFINRLVGDDEILEMNQLASSAIQSKLIFPEDDPGKRIVFAHMQDSTTKQKYYKFIGVFSELKGNMHYAACKRISDIIYLDGKGNFGTKPLHTTQN